MSAIEVKKQLHEMIEAMDEQKSAATFEFVNQIQRRASNQFQNLNADEIAAITQARLEIKTGKFLTMNEFNQLRKQWHTK
ncbi:MAG: hypothetical protein RIQ33_791 [Bacteroidota bacterium]|jgi:predicted transcriptional regulator